MAISLIDHTNGIASKVVGKFEETIPVKSGFSGWFPSETTPTLEVDVEVQRDTDLIAVDVMRFTEGNANKMSKVTQHKYIPPYFNEEYYFQNDAGYLRTIAMGVGLENVSINRAIALNAAKEVEKNRNKILRAIAKQQIDVLQYGIVTLKNGDNIDFRRKAASMVDVTSGGGQYWDNPLSTPIKDITDGLTYLRDVGNSYGRVVNVIMRGAAYTAFAASAEVQAEANVRRFERIHLDMPRFDNATGMAFQGQVAAGDFVVNLWTYNEKYTNEQGQTKYYLDEANVIILPDDFEGKTVFGGLPNMTTANIAGLETRVPKIEEAMFLLRGFSDEKTTSAGIGLSSAPLVIPFTIDKIYTMKVLA